MKILHLNTHQFGGAARAVHRLHAGLRRLGHDSILFLPNWSTADPDVMELNHGSSLLTRLARRVRRRRIHGSFARYQARPDGYELFSDDRSEYGPELPRQLPRSDVIHLHWVAGFVDYTSFFARALIQTPVVWSLHDMNAFTGGCHYDDGCGKYAASCGACPQLGSREEDDLSRQIWRRKREALAGLRPGGLHIVANCQWLAAEAARSSVLQGHPVSLIPYGLDVETFAPRDRLHARSVLGVPADAAVVLFVADIVTNRRKGFAVLAEALAGLSRPPNLFLLSLGSGTPALSAGMPHIHFGHVAGDRLLSVIYSAADVFVIPSLQDAFPQTALEAIACGTPVIGSAVGGIPDIVRPGVTGYLVPPRDARALGAVIAELLENPARRAEMSANCRRIAGEEYSLEVQARRYAQLYEKVLADFRREEFARV